MREGLQEAHRRLQVADAARDEVLVRVDVHVKRVRVLTRRVCATVVLQVHITNGGPAMQTELGRIRTCTDFGICCLFSLVLGQV